MRHFSLLSLTLFVMACAAPGPSGSLDGAGESTTLPSTDSAQTRTQDATEPPGGRRLGTTAAKLTLVDAYGCDGIDHIGMCSGDELLFCDAGELWAIDCPNYGLACGYSSAYDWFDCVEPVIEVVEPVVDPCGGLDYTGTCVGAEAHWCEGDAIAVLDCGAQGMVCDYLPDVGYYGCADVVVEPVDPCGGVGYEGACDINDDVVWCESGDLMSMSCAHGCGWNAAAGYFDCLPEPVVVVDPCEGVSFEGECIGDTVYWCDGVSLQSIECLYGCGFSDAGYFDCL